MFRAVSGDWPESGREDGQGCHRGNQMAAFPAHGKEHSPSPSTDRLRFLDGYSISHYMVHQPYSFSSPEAEMNAMADLVEAGKSVRWG